VTSRLYLKCDVCGSVTLIRVQVGWLDWHPIAVPCGKCGITLSGKAYFDPHKATARYEFPNAKQIDDAIPKFYLEVSGEFVTDKLRDYKGGRFVWSPPPFFQAIWEMGHDRNAEFKRKTVQFLQFARQDWPKVKRINELWLSGKHNYLPKEVAHYLPKRQFPMDNPQEYLRGVHQVSLLFLWPIMDHDRFKKTTDFLFRILPQLAQTNPAGLRKLSGFFADEGLLQSYDEKLVSCIDNLVLKFRYLIPVLSLRFYSAKPSGLLIKKGITTASFEDMKHFYAEMFEVATEVLPLAIAYNNLRYRGSFEAMQPQRRDVTTLQDFLQKSKGDRIQFLAGRESFDRLLYPHVDNKLRNAIAHTSYRYNARKQLISYFPSGIDGKGPARRMYLLDFAQRCWSLSMCIVNLVELVYQTRKLHYIATKGYEPIHPSVFGSPGP
jgi:hypothetical protein